MKAILLNNEEDICRAALDKWGPQKQTLKLFEEMSELQDAMCKQMDGRDSNSHVAEEIADVLLVLEQMIILHDCEQEVIKIKEEKLERLRMRIEKEVQER